MEFGQYGFIPSDLRHHKDIKPNSKLLYSEISATMQNGVCIKNNAYFSRVLNIHKSTITNCLSELRENYFIAITIENEKDTQKFLRRYIYLTPTGFQAEGNEISLTPPKWYFNGVGGSEDATQRNHYKTPNGNQSTISFNNDINYITSVKDKNAVLDKKLTEEQIKYLQEVVVNFYSKQSKRFPEIVNQDWQQDKALIINSINTLYSLIRLDKIDSMKMKKVLTWALDHKFWSDKILSIRELRVKASNGLYKFQNILHNYNTEEQRG